MLKTPPLSLYIHLPWCVQKCPYCDFNSHRQPLNPDYSRYVDSLLSDLQLELALVEGRMLETVFLGGGTPSLFPAGQVKRLLNGVSNLIDCGNSMEVTLEANPGTMEAGRFSDYREAGVNRLSIGVQSFGAAALQRLGRIHGPDEAIQAFCQARAAGFENINLDLMFGLPGQSVAEAGFDVETATKLAPEHISYYQLTIEPNTRFAASPPVLPGEGRLWDILLQGQAMLAAAGYQQYEVSAYARSQRECRHNLNYWNFGDYLGIGAGAHGKVSDTRGQRVRRRSRLAGPGAYLAAAGTRGVLAGDHYLTEADLVIEFMMNLLRLNQGFIRQLFQERTGLAYTSVQPVLAVAQQRGLLQLEDSGLKPSEMGRRYLNDLLALFI